MGSSTAYWFVPNHIVYVYNLGDLTADDFRAVDKQINDFMTEAREVHTEKVHVFVDSTEMTKLPPLTELEGGRILSYMRQPNCGWTVVVGNRKNVFLNILSKFLTSVSHVNLYMADTLEKGTSLFTQVDESLPELPDPHVWKANLPITG